ncbi:toxic anion resistance protein, partial [Halomonas sp. BBD48]|nr:toxic anion resistance protein [Halomonas sp. BBD48]
HSLSRGGLDRVLARIPGVGSSLQRYFRKYESAQQALDAIIQDLESGRDMLRRDNLTLSDDQDALHDTLVQLRGQVELGRLIDERLERRIAALDENDPQRAFIEEELLFPLRQRIVDLQQQLTVSQQGVLALEVVIRNNRELIRGVDRAINVTVSALSVAVTVAMALANQRLVLDRVEAINTATSDMIAGTAKALRGQGVDIQNRSSSAMLDMQKLEQAFQDVLAAIDDVSRYRREALPKLDAQIDRLDTLARRGDEAIHRMDKGNDAQTQGAV